jgi:hypothetical protein
LLSRPFARALVDGEQATQENAGRAEQGSRGEGFDALRYRRLTEQSVMCELLERDHLVLASGVRAEQNRQKLPACRQPAFGRKERDPPIPREIQKNETPVARQKTRSEAGDPLQRHLRCMGDGSLHDQGRRMFGKGEVDGISGKTVRGDVGGRRSPPWVVNTAASRSITPRDQG